MSIKLQCHATYNEDDSVKFIQYKCLGCGNFEEIITDNGNFKLEKFTKIYVKNNRSPFIYTCKRCNNETELVEQREEPLTP